MIKTVLSIDDDRVTQLINRHNLESGSFCEQIIEAFDGMEAMKFFEKLKNGEEPIGNMPQVIFLDLNMPVMDGWEFFDSFEKRFPEFIEQIKIFILSSSTNPADENRANREKNIVAFLAKPIDREMLGIVRTLLGIE